MRLAYCSVNGTVSAETPITAASTRAGAAAAEIDEELVYSRAAHQTDRSEHRKRHDTRTVDDRDPATAQSVYRSASEPMHATTAARPT